MLYRESSLKTLYSREIVYLYFPRLDLYEIDAIWFQYNHLNRVNLQILRLSTAV